MAQERFIAARNFKPLPARAWTQIAYVQETVIESLNRMFRVHGAESFAHNAALSGVLVHQPHQHRSRRLLLVFAQIIIVFAKAIVRDIVTRNRASGRRTGRCGLLQHVACLVVAITSACTPTKPHPILQPYQRHPEIWPRRSRSPPPRRRSPPRRPGQLRELACAILGHQAPGH